MKGIEFFFLWYFTSINAVYSFLLLLGLLRVYFRRKELKVEDITNILHSDSLPEICFIIPMHNEVKNIISTIHNILNLTYRYKEMIIVNDGSTDQGFPLLQKDLDLVVIPQFYQEQLKTEHIRGIYRSRAHPEIIVIDKELGGKFDAVNAGLNVCTRPFFIVADADSYLDDGTFEALIRPILATPEIMGVGASIRVKNGCSLEFNRVSTTHFPQKILPAMQNIEYLRSFLMRQGWNYAGGNFVIAGAFSIFQREIIIKLGGFCSSIAEDLEIVVRLHRVMKENHTPYKIVYLPDPVSWTEVPETLKDLGRQRTNWQLGTLESIWYHKKMCCNPKYGWFGFFNFPFLVFGEALEPYVEMLGYFYILISWIMGVLNIPFAILLICISLGFTFVYTIFCLFIEEISFRKYPSIRSLCFLVFCSFIENLGYRQMTIFWRIRGLKVFISEFSRIKKVSKLIQKMVKTAHK